LVSHGDIIGFSGFTPAGGESRADGHRGTRSR
jgi:hypothetical protein